MQDGILYLNGLPRLESYARRSHTADSYAPGMFWQCEHGPDGMTAETCRPTRDNWGPIVVPDGHYFMMGDNRDDSEDSRYWGFVERSAIRGRPLFVYYSFDTAADIAAPWLGSIRWDRIGDRVH